MTHQVRLRTRLFKSYRFLLRHFPQPHCFSLFLCETAFVFLSLRSELGERKKEKKRRKEKKGGSSPFLGDRRNCFKNVAQKQKKGDGKIIQKKGKACKWAMYPCRASKISQGRGKLKRGGKKKERQKEEQLRKKENHTHPKKGEEREGKSAKQTFK